MKDRTAIFISVAICAIVTYLEMIFVSTAIQHNMVTLVFLGIEYRTSMELVLTLFYAVSLGICTTFIRMKSSLYSMNLFYISTLFLLSSLYLVILKASGMYTATLFMPIFGFVILFIFTSFKKKTDKNEKKLKSLANKDYLTGLGNRKSIMETLNNKVKNPNTFYLIFITINNLKKVNDTLGHHIGDKTLVELANVWSGKPDYDYELFRLGGDEFAIILNNDSHEMVKTFASLLLNDIEQNKFISSLNCSLSASIGISKYPSDSRIPETLLSFADAAMFSCKATHRNSMKFFNKNIYIKEISNEIVEKKLKKVVNTKTGLKLLYQPQFDIKTRELRGVEVLSRILDDNGKIISPNIFIPVTESSSLIVDLDLIIFEAALKEAAQFLKYNDKFTVSLNVSGKHFQSDEFYQNFISIVKNSGFPLDRIEVEITESSLIDSIEEASEIANGLRSLGIKIALDDFGEGYSSLKYIYSIPFDTIKIDKYFVDGIKDSTRHYNVVSTIIYMAELLHCKTVAEGAEDEEQVKILTELGCDYIQGFIWGKPQSLEEVFSTFKKF